MFFKFKSILKQTSFKPILIIFCLFIFSTLFPATGNTFSKPLTKYSKGENSPHILKLNNFSLNARNVKVLKSQGNTLWIGTSMGVIKYDTSSFDNYVVYDNRNGLLSNGVFSIAIGPNNQIWIGTYGGGLSLMNGSKWVSL